MSDDKSQKKDNDASGLEAVTLPTSMENIVPEERNRLARRLLIKGCSVAPLVLLSVSTKKAVAATKVVNLTSLPLSL